MYAVRFFFLSAFILGMGACASTPNLVSSEAIQSGSTSSSASGKKLAVSTHGIVATEAARDVLKAGGNLIDAAIAASFVISVERPQSTGIGGGGFMLYRDGKSGQTYAIDFRERAPMHTYVSTYTDKEGHFISRRSQNGALAVGIPGLVAGLYDIHQRFGKLPFERLVAPAVELAENGFKVYPELAQALRARAGALRKDPGARAIFLDSKGEPWPIGHNLVQKDLAKTLRVIARKGKDGFYKGDVSRKIVSFMKAHRGVLNEEDLSSYRVKWREPLLVKFKDFDMYSMPPPSSGGIHVTQFLKFLEHDNLRAKGILSPTAIHLAASALQSAFADRARYLGDPDFVSVPTATLISSEYVAKRREAVSLDKARSLNEVGPGEIEITESDHTTHFSMMDDEGNAISSTQTVNGWMGAAIVPLGTGIVLNNEMDDFAAQDGSPNIFGAVGGVANAVRPGKTPLSSMAPAILVRDNKVRMVVGALGGTRIISCVAQTILNWAEFRLPLKDAISTIRYHHQWKPDELTIEAPGPGEKVVRRLEDMGYHVKVKPIACKVMAIAREGEGLSAVADPRDIGTSWAE